MYKNIRQVEWRRGSALGPKPRGPWIETTLCQCFHISLINHINIFLGPNGIAMTYSQCRSSVHFGEGGWGIFTLLHKMVH